MRCECGVMVNSLEDVVAAWSWVGFSYVRLCARTVVNGSKFLVVYMGAMMQTSIISSCTQSSSNTRNQ